jgi:hypothetical protein
MVQSDVRTEKLKNISKTVRVVRMNGVEILIELTQTVGKSPGIARQWLSTLILEGG